ncbi:hypothetical protein MAPG_01551 [Magnaporthiopsis poae ATCC 64411]|uniref:Heterokaryon incompatibility domain-containing protein n=1 Tax=Magnaporthiopsis poae (strain ATCC 64411 / 73-15) TaxID=644358 RepID=A0A0C4DP02_MAGP6|nr:hypothetical protein MAPG_01551 [Magnaporthiopsis poae ATCC 64411]
MADAVGFEALAFKSVDEVLTENRRNTSDVFRRFPIDSNAGEIRLLSLDGGGWDDPIKADLQVAGRPEESSDDGPVQYNAVSYVWGADDSTGNVWRYRIWLCGRPLLVTWNLFTVLRRLRVCSNHNSLQDARLPRLLWVDAVCINQADAEERGRQVRIMDRIYSGCAEVLVVLDEWQRQPVSSHAPGPDGLWRFQGDATDFGPLWQGYRAMFETAVGVRLVTSSGEKSALKGPGKVVRTMEAPYAGKTTDSQLSFLLAWTVRLLAQGYPIGDIAPFRPGMGGISAEAAELIHNLEVFTSRIGSARWFHRLWVVQEGVLGPAVRVLLGTASLPLDTLTAARANCQRPTKWERYPERFRSLRAVIQRLLDRINDVASLRRERGRKRPLLELCLRFMYRDAGLDHDRVFALLGLTAQSFEPDYGEELAAVYTRVSRSHIAECRSLTCLSFAEFRYRCKYTDEFVHGDAYGGLIPSWAVDFSAVSEKKLNGTYLVWLQRLTNFNACKGLAPLAADIDGDKLLLQGIEFDRVAKLANKCRPVWPCTYDPNFCDWCRDMDSSAESEDVGGDGTTWADTASLREYTSNIFDEGKADMFYHWRSLVRYRARDPERDAYMGGGTWADAWWRTLCLDHGCGPGRQLQRASEDEIRVLSTRIEREEPCMAFKTLHEFEEARKAVGLGISFDGLFRSLQAGDFNDVDTRTTDIVNGISPGLVGCKMFLTKKGYLGLGPASVWPGDSVFILPGARVPVILRRMVDGEGPVATENGSVYKLVGDSYIHGIMDGEAAATTSSAAVSLLIA